MAGMKILGYGTAHGDRAVSNDDMKEYVETSDQWIREKTGIGQRYFAENRSNTDMAAEAGSKALQGKSEEFRGGIDGVIVATFTPDLATPSVAAEVAGRLGISGRVMTLDVNSACSGFVYGLVLANSLLQCGGFQRILLIGSEKIHPLMDMEDRRTCVLFGDAAGAVVLERDPAGQFFHLEGTEPNHDILWCDRFDPKIRMAGQEVYRFAVSAVPECGEALLHQAGMTAEEVDRYIFHQANLRIIRSAARRMRIPEEKCFLNVEKYGNTSAASVAVALCECLEKDEIKTGDRIMAVGFGAGLTYGGVLMTI